MKETGGSRDNIGVAIGFDIDSDCDPTLVHSFCFEAVPHTLAAHPVTHENVRVGIGIGIEVM